MSVSIYNNNIASKLHYVYLITEILTNIKYIGVRTSKNLDLLADLKHYKTSTKNKIFKSLIRNGSLFTYEILSTHDSREEAVAEEIRLHELYDVAKNPEYYNKAKQTSTGYDTTGKVVVKDKDGNILHISCNSPLYLNGELKHLLHGKSTFKDIDGNIFNTNINDDRVLSGKLVGITKGYVSVKYKNKLQEPGFIVKVDDSRYLSGELVSANTGIMTVQDIHGNFLSIYNDDPRYLSGELTHINKGKVVVKDNDGNNIQVDITDALYINGTYKSVATNRVIVKDNLGNNYCISVDDSRYINGELVHVLTGTKHSAETKQKMSDSHKNKKFSEETLARIKESKKNTPKIKCVHCNRYLVNGHYIKWHGDKCKKRLT